MLFFSNSLLALTEVQINRLSLLAKSWAAAKNFHSGACQINWDDALINTIPSVVDAVDSNQFNQNLDMLLNQLGQNQVALGTIPVTPEMIAQEIDLTWLEDTELNLANRNRVKAFIEDFRPRSNCYVDRGTRGVGEGGYSRDNQYFNVSNPNREVRLLALFRFWNIINYYFPYKNLIDQSWDQVLEDFIPLIYDADSNLEYHKLMRVFTAQIKDSHAFFISPTLRESIDRYYLPFVLKTIEGKVIVYKKTDVQNNVGVGDEVITINGESMQVLWQKNRLLTAASNPTTLVRNTDVFLNIGSEGPVDIELKSRDNERYSVQTSYGQYPADLYTNTSAKWANMDQDSCSIGYVDMGQLNVVDIPQMMNQFMNKDAIVFDIRNYPNGTLWTLVNYLFPSPLNNARFAQADFSYPGAYRWVNSVIGQGTSNPYDGRVIILFNEETQSQAEYTVMALEKHPNAVKIGSQTAAADGNITKVDLPGEIQVYFTGLGVYYADNKPTQRIGIIPDVFVRPSIQGIVQGRDEVLERALNCEQIADLNWPEPIEPKGGLFWDISQSGKGFDIANFEHNYAILPYDFRADGSPVWYLGLAESDQGVLSLIPDSMFEYSHNSETNSLHLDPLDTAMDFDFKQGIFEIECAVSDPENKRQPSQLVWQNNNQIETQCLEELVFSGSDAVKDYTGLWYGGVEDNGWGVSINTQGNRLVAIVYMYDTNGQAMWLVGSGDFNMEGPTELNLLKANGFCENCDDPGVSHESVGNLTLSLSEPSQVFVDQNWISLTVGNSIWNRERMPIKMLSKPH